jgi:hypothetical protein
MIVDSWLVFPLRHRGANMAARMPLWFSLERALATPTHNRSDHARQAQPRRPMEIDWSDRFSEL